jgi:hypothetical protein
MTTMIGYFRHGNRTQPYARLYVSNIRDPIRETSYPSLETLSLNFELGGMTIICTMEFPVPPRNKPDRVRSCFVKWSWVLLRSVPESKCTKFQKGHVCKKIKNESLGSSPGANRERFPWLGSFDMKDTLNLLSWASDYFVLCPQLPRVFGNT